jgi:hypothetical protein
MAYIGREPQIGNFQICDAISTVNNQAAYTMQVSSVDVLPESANHMIVSLNGVIQKPNSSYTVSGATITFASNLVTGDVINFIQILGSVLDLGVPSDDTVTLAKMAPGTDGNIISYDTSGNPVAVATGNDGQVLTSAGAGAVPTFETLPAGTTLSGSTNNTVATVTGANALVGEANLTFDGSTLGVAGAASITRSGGTPVIINRTSNFGELIKFRKDGSDIGKIDCTSAGIGIYLGGTAAANNLDDYEEGTFTPTWASNVTVSVASGNYGYYTKIGNVVIVHFGAVLNASSPSYYRITNAPFQSNITSGQAIGSAKEYGQTGYQHHTYMANDSTTITIKMYDNTGVSNAYLNCSLTYRVD